MGVGGLPPFITLLILFHISLTISAIIKYGGSRTGKVKSPTLQYLQYSLLVMANLVLNFPKATAV